MALEVPITHYTYKRSASLFTYYYCFSICRWVAIGKLDPFKVLFLKRAFYIRKIAVRPIRTKSTFSYNAANRLSNPPSLYILSK